MRKTWLALVILLAAGCKTYEDARPPVDQLDKRDKGLQSKDVVQASEQMAMSLLGDPALNGSKDQWTIVVGNMQNQTTRARHAMDIFIERLRIQLARHGKGRVQLIQNRAGYRDRQAGELETDARPDGQPGAKGVQPDYQLDGKVMELPNRGTSYYLMEFSVNDLHNRTIPWTDAYEVRVER